MPPPQEGKAFNDTLIEAIDETITVLFSREVADALYSHLERVHKVTQGEFPNRLEVLLSTLEGIFGKSGAKTISRAIARSLFKKLELSPLEIDDTPRRNLIDYTEKARRMLLDRDALL